MRRRNTMLIIALALAAVASLALHQVNVVSAQGNEPVGVVMAYTPGQSITIVDHEGTQHQYQLSSSLMILPPGRASSLVVGSFVTVIAPASSGNGTPIAMGIVVHPQVPPGWNVQAMSPTAVPMETLVRTSTATSTATLLETSTPTPTGTLTETPTPNGTATETTTPTVIGTTTETATPIATQTGSGTAITTNAVIEWLRALFRALLTHS